MFHIRMCIVIRPLHAQAYAWGLTRLCICPKWVAPLPQWLDKIQDGIQQSQCKMMHIRIHQILYRPTLKFKRSYMPKRRKILLFSAAEPRSEQLDYEYLY